MATFYVNSVQKAYSRDNITWHQTYTPQIDWNATTVIFRPKNGDGDITITTATDPVVLDGTTKAPGFYTPLTLVTALQTAFPKANTGSGGTGTGATGPQGPQGVGVSTAAVNGSGHLIITKTDTSTVDAGVVVGATGPQGPAGADGAVVNAALTPTAVKTSAYTAVANDLVKVDASGGTVPITLPAAPPDKTRIGVKMIAVSGTNTATITRGGTDVFNKTGGSTSVSLTLLNQSVLLQYESATGIWNVTSGDVPLTGLDARFGTLVQQTADVAAIAAINTRLQAETQTYIANIIAAGGRIDASTIDAIDKFVTWGKRDGWFALLNYIAPFCGSNLASSLVLLKAPNGVTFTSTLFADADFDNAKGLTATTGKYLQTGYVPVTQGLTVTNFTMAAVRMAFTRTNTSVFLSSIPTTGEGSPMIDFNVAAIVRSNQTSAASEGQRAVVYTGRSGSWAGFSDGVQIQLGTTSLSPTANTLQFEMTVFRGKLPDGNIYLSNGTIGFLAFGTSLTDAQSISLNKAMLQFTQDIRTWFVKRGVAFSVLGDSNGQAWQGNPTWANLLTTEYGWREFNNSQAGSRLNIDASGTLSGLNRYLQVIETNPEYGFIALGTNDALQDGQANGLGTTATALTTNLNTICTAYKNKSIKPFILGVPWNSTINATKAALYEAACASAAKTSGVPFVDLYNLFADQPTPSVFFTDGTHFGGGGYQVVANAIKERLQGRMFRTPTLDFPSIPAQSSADLTVTVYTAVAGMSVSLSLPAALETGLVANAFVSANDTVTVRLTNVTAAAIDPAAAQYKVTVFVNY